MFGIRVVIADTDPVFRRNLKESFRQADYHVVGEAKDARSTLQLVFQAEPQVVVLDPRIPGSEGIELTGIIDEHRVCPVVAVISRTQSQIEDFARLPGVYGILLKPLNVVTVQPVIETALANFERAMKLEKELKSLRTEFENRKIVERAKGLLMEKKKLTEREAYKQLQKISMDKCTTLDRVARNVIRYYEANSD